MSEPSRNALAIRRLRAEAVARGDCLTCRCRPAKPGRKTCQHCLDEGNRHQRKLEAKRRRNRLCPMCGGKPVRGKSMCRACLDKTLARVHAAIDRGMCRRCYKPRGADGTGHNCRACADMVAEKARVRHAAKVAAGFCIRDGCNAPLESESMCFGHLMAMRRYSRERLRREQEARAA